MINIIIVNKIPTAPHILQQETFTVGGAHVAEETLGWVPRTQDGHTPIIYLYFPRTGFIYGT